jgi:hypothetical protein
VGGVQVALVVQGASAIALQLRMVLLALLIPGGDPAELLEPVDRALHWWRSR